MDVHEDKEKNIITASFELPGLKKEDVHIDMHNSVLTVSGETKIDETKEQDGYAVRERRFGRFSRSIPVPQGIKVSFRVASTSVTKMLIRVYRKKRSKLTWRTVC